MAPAWQPEEASSEIYQDVEKHSQGMISFKYRPPSRADLDALKNTETYRKLIEEQGEASLGLGLASENGDKAS